MTCCHRQTSRPGTFRSPRRCAIASLTQAAASPRRPRPIALTRRTGFDDGFGAQLQRVLATYCICQEFGYDYVHTPLANIEYQGLQSLLEQKNSVEFVAACNERIEKHISSSDIVPPTPEGLQQKYECVDAEGLPFKVSTA